ncbi:MAG: hypothetical protein ACT4NU_04575 [Chromatiales bacterium]
MPPLEALIKPVTDALLAALEKAKSNSLKRSARRALSEAIKELVKIDPDVDAAEAKIAVARAAGIIERELFTAQSMLAKVKRDSRRKAQAGQRGDGRRRSRERTASKK